MKVLLDACVLYPTILRALLFRRAEAGAFQPLWSARILEEWRRAALKSGALFADAEVASARAVFPKAEVQSRPSTEARLVLPDPNDVHVLAAAIDGSADELLTFNVKDFPGHVLSEEGIQRRSPDEFLLELFFADEIGMRRDVDATLAEAAEHGIDVSNPRSVFKRARLARFGKALAQP